LLIHDLTLDLF